MKELTIFAKRRRTYTLVFLGGAALFALAAFITEYSIIDAFTALPKVASWIVRNLIPTDRALAKMPIILAKLAETVLLSLAVTVCAAVCAFAFSLAGTNITNTNTWRTRIVRMIASFFRNVPDIVWAMILLFAFGQNILTGFFAMFFTTFGLLTRMFIEIIDETSAASVEALQAVGATYMHVVFQGIVPSAIAEVASWVLFMIETNIRNSTLIGILTATGVGYLFDLYYKMLDYSAASLVVMTVMVVTVLIEMISRMFRRVII